MNMAHAHAQSSVNSSTCRTLAWIGIALQAIALVFVLWSQKWGGAWTIGIFLVLSVAFMWIEERLPSLISLLVVIAAIINAGGWTWNWYHQFVWFDEFVHAFTSFAVMSAIGYAAWARDAITDRPGSGSFILKIALWGVGLGIVWEIFESLFLNLTFWDTIVDLVMDTIGAAIAGWFIGWTARKQGAVGSLAHA